jgi:hypothetical protein
VRPDVVAVGFEPDDEMRSRMNGREARDLNGIENAKHIELSFLRKVGGIGENCEGDVHQVKVAAPSLARLAFADDRNSHTSSYYR